MKRFQRPCSLRTLNYKLTARSGEEMFGTRQNNIISYDTCTHTYWCNPLITLLWHWDSSLAGHGFGQTLWRDVITARFPVSVPRVCTQGTSSQRAFKSTNESHRTENNVVLVEIADSWTQVWLHSFDYRMSNFIWSWSSAQLPWTMSFS